MAEEIIFKNEIPKHDYFSLLILGQGRGGKLEPIKEVYDKPVQIELIVNGQQVFLQDFRDTMQDWAERLERKYKEEYDTLARSTDVVFQAEKIVKAKFDKYLEGLYKLKEELLEDLDNEYLNEVLKDGDR